MQDVPNNKERTAYNKGGGARRPKGGISAQKGLRRKVMFCFSRRGIFAGTRGHGESAQIAAVGKV